MKKTINEIVEIPEGVEVTVENNKVSVKGKEGELQRDFQSVISIVVKDKELILSYKNASKREKKIINTTKAHILNMIKGVQEKFVYHLKVVFAHFPITTNIEGSKMIIKNFLGERKNRETSIHPEANVEINGNEITITSSNKEAAGQTAANFERLTKIRNKDRRVFQDGIYITEKPGRKI